MIFNKNKNLSRIISFLKMWKKILASFNFSPLGGADEAVNCLAPCVEKNLLHRLLNILYGLLYYDIDKLIVDTCLNLKLSKRCQAARN